MTNENFYLFTITGYFFAGIFSPVFLKFLHHEGIIAVNFVGKSIPQSAGLVLSGSFFAGLLFLQLSMEKFNSELMYLLLSGLFIITLLGLLDDLVGDKKTKGLKGHGKQLLKGNLTTGGLKAIGGGFVAIFLAVPFSQYFWEIIVNSLLITLAINGTNLFDLRPGRAGKAFLTGILLVAIFGDLEKIFWTGLPVGAVLAYLPYDLKGKAMMGDTGSNALGMVLGVAMVGGLSPTGKMAGLVILMSIHIYAEYKSISILIQETAILAFFDKLGRQE